MLVAAKIARSSRESAACLGTSFGHILCKGNRMVRVGSTMNGERLSALDATFLEVETRESPMGIGAVCVFAGGTMVSADGSFDTARMRAHVAHAIAQLPRYRQRLAMTH